MSRASKLPVMKKTVAVPKNKTFLVFRNQTKNGTPHSEDVLTDLMTVCDEDSETLTVGSVIGDLGSNEAVLVKAPHAETAVLTVRKEYVNTDSCDVFEVSHVGTFVVESVIRKL